MRSLTSEALNLLECYCIYLERGRNGFDGIESLCEGVSGSELP